MLITVERHDDFEEMLLARGLFKEGLEHMGTIRLYLLDNKTIVTYASNAGDVNYVFIRRESDRKNESTDFKEASTLAMCLSNQILDPILRESYTPKEYKVKKSVLYNREVSVRLIHIESGDIKVFSAVEGLDHAADIFEDIPVEVKQTQFLTLEKAAAHLFMNTLLP